MAAGIRRAPVRGGLGAGSRPDPWSQVLGDAERPLLAGGADAGSASRFALFAEVCRRLAEAAGPSGLLLVFDDLQWADEASAALLADVVRQLRGRRILVFASYRAAPGLGDETLLRLSSEANAERVDLHGLPAEAIGDLLRATGLPASPAQVDEVHSETDGNPFMVRELARMLIEQRRGGSGSVPGRLVDATAHRLAQVSPPARALLQTAAVAGTTFSAGVVARMLDEPVLSLLAPLNECRAAGFVVPSQSAAEQQRLHAAAADAIEGLYEGQMRLHLAEVARHRVEASRPGDRADRTRAMAACEAAASMAADAVAFEEAVRLYRQALSAGGEEAGEADRARLELALAAVLHRSGDLPGAQTSGMPADVPPDSEFIEYQAGELYIR